VTPSLLLGLAIVVGAPAPKETPKDPPKLEGDWIVESIEGPKEAGPARITMRFTESKILILEGEKPTPDEAGYTADLKKKPATIDIRPEKGQKDKMVQGIIEITGDTMKLCFARDAKERPTEFKGDAANGIMMITLKRVKAEK
jgi:uncharacterized protein (TIGR03067 family)